MPKIVCIIPARLKSQRFPRKMLALLKGKPLIQWVWEAACRVDLFDSVAIAVDAEEVAEVVKGFGGRFFMTDPHCASGTDRLVQLERSGLVDADIWVNWQGDEPFIHRAMIVDLLQTCQTEKSDIWTLKKKIVDPKEVASPHFAKVVADHFGFALYFSRSPIPYYRDARPEQEKIYFKHVGLYAYTKAALHKLSRLSPCSIEEAEQLEQLRFLYHGLKIRIHETQHEVFGIDLPEHAAAAERLLERNGFIH